MQNFSYHVPIYVVNGGVATSGHSADLTPAKVGIFGMNSYVATTVGSDKEFFFAQGNTGGINWYGQRVKESHKSPFFLGKDVEDMYVSYPQEPVNEEWVIGYNGSPSSKSLRFEKGVPVRLKVYFHGEPTYRFWNGPKEFVVSYTPTVDCDEPCTSLDCPEPDQQLLFHTKNLIDNFNNHTELFKFGASAKLVDSEYVAATPNMTKYCLSVCDNGDAVALQAVQSQVLAVYTVERIARVGSISTYQICIPTAAAAPAAFAQSGSVLLAVCATCPAGSTLTAAADVYYVQRPVLPTTDLSTPSARTTYAGTVNTAYSGTGGTFIGLNDGVATVAVKVAAGATVTALNSDIVEFGYESPAVCTFAAPASIAWATCGVGIRSKRTLRIKNINRPDCDADGDRIDDITAAINSVKGIDIGTLTLEAGDACKDDYTVEQFSDDCLEEGCLTSNVTFSYTHVPAFENEQWEVIPDISGEIEGRKTGIRITANFDDIQFGNCSFDPRDYFNMEPLKMEVSLLGEDEDVCDVANWPTVSQSRIGQIGRQSGEWLVREVILKDKSYLKHADQFSLNPRMREAFEMNTLDRVDRNAYYVLYYVKFRASYGFRTTYRKGEQEQFTAVFAFKEGDPTLSAFEASVINVLTAKSGVVPERIGLKTGGSSGQQQDV